MIQVHTQVVLDFVGLGEIGKAKASFETLQEMASAGILELGWRARGYTGDRRIAGGRPLSCASPLASKTPVPPRRCDDH